jgi:hypothetical protein
MTSGNVKHRRAVRSSVPATTARPPSGAVENRRFAWAARLSNRGQTLLEYALIIIVIGLTATFIAQRLGVSIRCKILEATVATTGETVPGLSGCPGAEDLLADDEDSGGPAPPQQVVRLEVLGWTMAEFAPTPVVPASPPPPPPPAVPPPPPTPSWPPQCLGCHDFKPLGPTDCGPMPYHWVTHRPDMCPHGCCVMTRH